MATRLPEVVKRNAELANRLIAQRAAGRGNTGYVPDPAAPNVLAKGGIPAAPVTPAAPVVTPAPPAQPTNLEAPRDFNEENPYAIDPADLGMPAAPAGPMTVAPNLPAEIPAGPADWEHKYSVLQGMHDADRNAWTEERRGLQDQISILVNSTPSSVPPTPMETANPYGVAPETVEALGEDLVKSMQAVARHEVHLAEDRFNNKVQQISTAHTETVEDMFYSELNTQVSDWRVINHMPQFKVWLGEAEGMTGQSRQDFLQQAYDERNAPVVIGYFNGFKATQQGPAADNPEVLETITPVTIPGGGAQLPSGPATGKPVYTRASIDSFYKDKALGRFRNNPEQAARIERDIFDAQREGRILIGRTVPPPMRG